MGSCGVDACLFVQIWLDLCNIYSMQQFNNNNKLAINNLGKLSKSESDEKFFYFFLDTRPLFENFLKKKIFPLWKVKNT